MITGSIYSASDKALFDAINQSSVTAADLRELFLRHGIIISNGTPRRQLAMHFARLMHDFDDFETLARIFESPKRRERMSATRILGAATIHDVEAAAHAIVGALVEQNDAATTTVQPDGSIQIHIKYKQLHFNKSEFRQVETKAAVITIEQEGGSLVMRGPQNDKVDEVCEELINHLEIELKLDVETDRIDLRGISDSKARVEFFRLLIDGVKGYQRTDVTDVYLFNPEKKRSSAVALADEDNLEISADDDVDLGIHIKSANLKGGRVLDSPELRSFFNKGFYISKIIWQCKEIGTFDSDIVEFEAQFSEPESCTSFSYLVRGYYEYQEAGDHSKGRKQFGKDVDREIGKLIEESARAAIQSL
jgi:hypothetical protein